MTIRLLVSLLALLALVLPASALGAWEPAQQLPAQPNRELELGLDGQGDGVLAWTEYTAGSGVLYVARRAPAASFAAPQPVSALGQDVRGFALATTPQGPAALAWRAGREPDGQILVLLWRLGGPLPTARALTGVGVLPPASRAGTRIIENAVPAVATGRDGWALAAWLARGPKNCGYAVRAAVRAPAREFDRAASVSSRCAHASRPDVAVAAGGLGLVTWRQGQRLYGAVTTGRRLGPARLLSAHSVSPGPAVAATDDRIVVAWRRVSGPVMAREIRDGRVARPRAVSRTSRVLDPPRLAASVGGAIAAAWQTTSDVLAPIRFTLSPAAGRRFSAPETVAPRGVADGRNEALRIALDRAGDALVTWCGQPLGSNARPFGGSFLGREDIFAPVTGLTVDDPCAGGRDRVRLAVAQDTGEALLAWTRRPRLLVARRAGPLSSP